MCYQSVSLSASVNTSSVPMEGQSEQAASMEAQSEQAASMESQSEQVASPSDQPFTGKYIKCKP